MKLKKWGWARHLPAAAAFAACLFAGSGAWAAAPAFTITAPQDGATVVSPVVVQVDTHGIPIGQPIDGADHLHVSVDGGPELAVYRNGDISLPLQPGMHAIAVELAGPTHRPLLPPKIIHVLVR